MLIPSDICHDFARNSINSNRFIRVIILKRSSCDALRNFTYAANTNHKVSGWTKKLEFDESIYLDPVLIWNNLLIAVHACANWPIACSCCRDCIAQSIQNRPHSQSALSIPQLQRHETTKNLIKNMFTSLCLRNVEATHSFVVHKLVHDEHYSTIDWDLIWVVVVPPSFSMFDRPETFSMISWFVVASQTCKLSSHKSHRRQSIWFRRNFVAIVTVLFCSCVRVMYDELSVDREFRICSVLCLCMNEVICSA